VAPIDYKPVVPSLRESPSRGPIRVKVPMLAKMYERRRAGYKAIGYEIDE
jgi:hypothetical protein